jgi:signal transduction histidine kinase
MSSEQLRNLFSINSQHLINSPHLINSLPCNEETAGEHGTGLGLIVCREMLEKHKSVLHVESEAGKGSRFWFTLISA